MRTHCGGDLLHPRARARTWNASCSAIGWSTRHVQRVRVLSKAAADGPDTSPWGTLEESVGKTPLVRLHRLGAGLNNNVLLAKLEGYNPTGSDKDRAAFSMVAEAERRGLIKAGGTLIEATSGNMGVALAMVAAIKGYKLKAITPRGTSAEYAASMAAFGAQLIAVEGGLEEARDLAASMQANGEGYMLDQFSNPDNPLAHLQTTGPELWDQTQGRITHLVATMGTTGTLMGASAYLKLMNPDVQTVGVQPGPGADVQGILRWPAAHTPLIFQSWRVDSTMDVSQAEAETTMRVLARAEGIFAGVSSGGAVSAALRLSAQVKDSVICVILCDKGDRYLSTGLYSADASARDPAPCSCGEFWSAVQCLVAGFPGPHWVLFIGQEHQSERHAQGAPWCEDSIGVASALRMEMATSGGTLLVCHVGSEEEWVKADHPLRVHPQVRLRLLPTLMLWQAGPAGASPTRRTSGDKSGLLGLMASAAASAAAGNQPKMLNAGAVPPRLLSPAGSPPPQTADQGGAQRRSATPQNPPRS